MKLNARYVSIGDSDDLYFEVSFENQHPAADYDPSAPTEPYLLLQRQFEDDDRGVRYLETHDTDRFAGHFRLRLIEFTPTHLVFEIDRAQDRSVEVTYKLSTDAFVRSSASFASSSVRSHEDCCETFFRVMGCRAQ